MCSTEHIWQNKTFDRGRQRKRHLKIVKVNLKSLTAIALHFSAITYLAPPPVLFIHVIILTYMDDILNTSFGNVDYATFPLWWGWDIALIN